MAVRIGLVGLGMMGRMHLEAYGGIDSVELAAVCDVDASRMEQFAPGARHFDDFSKLLDEGQVDAVDLCIPTDLHADFAVQALEAGRDVFCEKPIARTADVGMRMCQVAERAGRRLMVGHVLRFWPEYVAIGEMITSGRFGRVKSAFFRRISGFPEWDETNWYCRAERSGSAALDLHIHDVDLVQWYFGVPAAVGACGVVEDDGGVSRIFTRYEFENGPAVAAEGSWLPGAVPFVMSATVAFETATVEYNSSMARTLTIYPNGGEPEHPAVAGEDGYRRELRYFVDCIESGKPIEQTSPADAARAVGIVEAEIRSVRTAKPIPLRL